MLVSWDIDTHSSSIKSSILKYFSLFFKVRVEKDGHLYYFKMDGVHAIDNGVLVIDNRYGGPDKGGVASKYRPYTAWDMFRKMTCCYSALPFITSHYFSYTLEPSLHLLMQRRVSLCVTSILA